jgi:hypothetical protein
MKRWTIRIFVFLLLGATVNVAVAWGLCICAPVQHIQSISFHQVYGGWTATFFPKFGSESRFVVSATDRDIEPSREHGESWIFAGKSKAPSTQPGAGVYAQARGWPFRSLCWHTFTVDLDKSSELSCGWALGPEPLLDGALPLRPIWPGFAINTVFYAAVLWVLFALGGTPFALRKWRRIRHGLCPKCGYDLRGGGSESTTCPECGAPAVRE